MAHETDSVYRGVTREAQLFGLPMLWFMGVVLVSALTFVLTRSFWGWALFPILYVPALACFRADPHLHLIWQVKLTRCVNRSGMWWGLNTYSP